MNTTKQWMLVPFNLEAQKVIGQIVNVKEERECHLREPRIFYKVIKNRGGG